MRIRPVGAHALLLDHAETTPTGPPAGSTADSGDVPDQDPAGWVEAWRAELWRRREAGELDAVEIVPAATTVLLDGVPDPAATAARIAGWTPRPTTTGQPARTVEVPVRYDGTDLPTVAAHWGVPVPEVVRRLTGTPFRVAFCGFAPGFGYLAGSRFEWDTPRRSSPRTRVPAGAVALAGEFTGVYPRESPGGWQLLGHALVDVFDLDRDPPALLVPGATVRFVEAS